MASQVTIISPVNKELSTVKVNLAQTNREGGDDCSHLARVVAAALSVTNSYCVVDFGSGSIENYDPLEAREELRRLYEGVPELKPQFQPGELGGAGGEYWKTEKNEAKRSDLIHWLTEEEMKQNPDRYPNLARYRNSTRNLVDKLLELQMDGDARFTFQNCPLRPTGGEVKPPHLENDRMMLAVYPVIPAENSQHEGSRFTVHCDNPPGEEGTGDNGRVLTFTHYLNPDWNSELLGGNLRIYDNGWTKSVRPSASALERWNKFSPTEEPAGIMGITPPGSRSSSLEVAPRLNRLVIFFSDERVPHEVLPVKVKESDESHPVPNFRYSVTLWYNYLSPEAQLRGMKAAFSNWAGRLKAKREQATS